MAGPEDPDHAKSVHGHGDDYQRSTPKNLFEGGDVHGFDGRAIHFSPGALGYAASIVIRASPVFGSFALTSASSLSWSSPAGMWKRNSIRFLPLDISQLW